jgi:uncharacterized membrane protein YkoI
VETAETEMHEAPVGDKPATTLAAAIAIAQKSIPDGRFLKGVIEEEDGKTICSIVLASGEGQREVNIDAASGAILGTENEKLEPESGEVLAAVAKDSAHTPIGAVKAIEAALEKTPSAWAYAASLENPTDGLTYFVVLIDGKSAKVAEVSALDGKVQKISDLEEEEEGEEGMEESKEKEETPPAKPK